MAKRTKVVIGLVVATVFLFLFFVPVVPNRCPSGSYGPCTQGYRSAILAVTDGHYGAAYSPDPYSGVLAPPTRVGQAEYSIAWWSRSVASFWF